MTSNEEIIGWVWAKACSLLDKGVDPRIYVVPKLLDDFKQDFREQEDSADCLERRNLLCERQHLICPDNCKHMNDC